MRFTAVNAGLNVCVPVGASASNLAWWPENCG